MSRCRYRLREPEVEARVLRRGNDWGDIIEWCDGTLELTDRGTPFVFLDCWGEKDVAGAEDFILKHADGSFSVLAASEFYDSYEAIYDF